MQDAIDSGELCVAPMWKFYGLDKKHRREDANGEHLECIICHEVPLEEDPIPHMVQIVECKCNNVFHLNCFKSMLEYCARKCPFCATKFKDFDLETNPTGLNEQSNWSDFFHELSINPDDTSEDKVYTFRDDVGIGNLAGASDVKYRKFIEAHVNQSPANPDSSTVSMSDLLSRYRTFTKEQNLPFHFSKDDKALKREMVVLCLANPLFAFLPLNGLELSRFLPLLKTLGMVLMLLRLSYRPRQRRTPLPSLPIWMQNKLQNRWRNWMTRFSNLLMTVAKVQAKSMLTKKLATKENTKRRKRRKHEKDEKTKTRKKRKPKKTKTQKKTKKTKAKEK